MFRANRPRKRSSQPPIPAAIAEYLEPRRMLAGNVAVTVNPGGDILRIIGDNSANRIDVSYNDGTGEIVVTPTDATTTINGGAMFAQAFATPPSIRMRLADGSDSVTGTLRRSMPEPGDSRPIIDEGFFRLGRGIDTFDMQIDYISLVTVIGDSGDDTITLEAFNYESAVEKAQASDAVMANFDDPAGVVPKINDPALRLFGFDGDDVITVDRSSVVGSLLMEGGNDNDQTYFDTSDLVGLARFDFGAGDDAGGFRTVAQSVGRLVFKGRTGDDLMEHNGSSSVYTGADAQPFRADGDSGNDSLVLSASIVSLFRAARGVGDPEAESSPSGTFFFNGGTGNDFLDVNGSIITAGGFEFDQGPGSDLMTIGGGAIGTMPVPLPNNTPTRGGGRFLVRGRGGDDALLMSASVIETTGKFIFDGDADDDAIMLADDSRVDVDGDITIEGNFGDDRVVIEGGSISAGGNIIGLLGADDDDLLLYDEASITATGSVTINGEGGTDEFALEAMSTVPATASLVSFEDPTASVSLLQSATEDYLNALAAAFPAGRAQDTIVAFIAFGL